jgi:hypothetical protein
VSCPAGKFSTVHQPTVNHTCGGSGETGTGWWESANCSGGCIPSAAVTSGNISKSAEDYGNNANCWWLMDASPGDKILCGFIRTWIASAKSIIESSEPVFYANGGTWVNVMGVLLVLVSALVASAEKSLRLAHPERGTAGRKRGTTTTMALAATSLAVLVAVSQVQLATAQACAAGKYKDAARPQVVFRTDESPWGWQEAYDEATAAGRRLPTIAELRAYINSNPSAFTQFNGLDRWTPVVNPGVANTKDWAQIGNYWPPGISHFQDLPSPWKGYPPWGDSGTGAHAQVYTEVFDTCTDCAAGKYKDTSGSAACTLCTAGKYSAAVGDTAASTCADCGSGEYSAAGASVCSVCEAGKALTSTAAASINIDGGNWTLVRRVPRGSSWHPTSDRCAGTAVYGPSGMLTDWQSNAIGAGWSTDFAQAVPGYNQLLFVTGDNAVWLITTKEAVGGELVNPPQWYENAQRTILKSSNSNNAYTALWYNRGSSGSSVFSEDPWVSVIDHGPAITQNKMVYGANSVGGQHAYILQLHNGANVFVRNTAAAGPVVTICTSCVAGKYTAAAGSTVCSNCTAGTYIALTGASACIACPAHTFSGAGSKTLVNCACNKGYTGPDGVECTACDAGGFKDTNGSAACTLCSAGKYSESTAQTTCANCSAGKYKATAGVNTACDNCAAGKYGEENGASSNSVCQDCEAGKYLQTQGNDASSDCVSCEAGKYSRQQGAVSGGTCQACVAGKYSTGGAATCTDCRAGTFSSTVGGSSMVSCNLCPAGKYGEDVGASSDNVCKDCDAGKYLHTQGNDGSSDCVSCSAGTYSPQKGAVLWSTCGDCVKGKYSAAGAAQCTPCTDHSTTSSTASTSSSFCLCVEGYTGNHNGCSACVLGTFKPVKGDEACTSCAAGKYSAGATGAAACVLTPPSPDTCYGAAAMIDLLNASCPRDHATQKTTSMSCGTSACAFFISAIDDRKFALVKAGLQECADDSTNPFTGFSDWLPKWNDELIRHHYAKYCGLPFGPKP